MSIATAMLLSTLLTAVLGFGTYKFQKRENLDVQRELMQEQNQLNIEQWNRENEYNTPAAQMQRFAQAGMNPNLAYGLSNLSANSPQLSTSLGENVVPDIGSIIRDMSAPIQQGVNAYRNQHQADLTLEQIEKLVTAQGLDNKLAQQAASNTELNGQRLINLSEELNVIKAQVAELSSRTRSNNAAARVNEVAAAYQERTLDYRITICEKEMGMKSTEAKYFDKMMRANLALTQSSTRKNKMDVIVGSSQYSLNLRAATMYFELAREAKTKADYVSAQLQIYKMYEGQLKEAELTSIMKGVDQMQANIIQSYVNSALSVFNTLQQNSISARMHQMTSDAGKAFMFM